MTLREIAEKAGRGRHADCPWRMYGSTCGVCERLVTDIERVAKDFAERVATKLAPGVFYDAPHYVSHEDRHAAITRSIAAAERGE